MSYSYTEEKICPYCKKFGNVTVSILEIYMKSYISQKIVYVFEHKCICRNCGNIFFEKIYTPFREHLESTERHIYRGARIDVKGIEKLIFLMK